MDITNVPFVVSLEFRGNVHVTIQLTGSGGESLVRNSPRAEPSAEAREAWAARTLAAASWLMPNLAPALIAEVLQLGHVSPGLRGRDDGEL
ncbi:hypothetical protein [Streptomyces sp. RFCAC02]|uniref:hypothetical protein n=1 Tax=Streptomyces sp. RFCAC02 TaxID=2499143 RepID=UPI00101F9BFA|nr:hypothetical protein [Streptomyces sp. RFCAC02]